MITKSNPIFRRIAWVGVATALLLGLPQLNAEEEKQLPQLSEKVSDALQKLKPLQDAKNYQGMLSIVDGALSSVNPSSYDYVYLLDVKAKVYLQLDQYDNAIPSWEQYLKLSEQYGYSDPKWQLEVTKYLAQLIFSEANNEKDKAKQQTLVQKASSYLKQYLAKAPKPEPDVQMLYAQILYFRATADSAHIDQQSLREAREVVEQAMLNQIHPKDSFYVIQLAILQQENDYKHAAEVTELMLKLFPNKKDAWPMLFSTYVNLAGAAKPESDEQRAYQARAINTIERAQSLGFMKTPRDNFNLVTLYLNAGQFSKATDMLYEGMKKGAIESTINNWRILGAYYLQANKELQAINALEEACKLFPHEGSFDFQIGQIYQQLDKVKEAHDHYARAVRKGNLGERPHQVYLFLAYSALELGDYDGALKAINDAIKMPDGAKDPQVKTVKEGIEATIQEHEMTKKAKEEAAKRSF